MTSTNKAVLILYLCFILLLFIVLLTVSRLSIQAAPVAIPIGLGAYALLEISRALTHKLTISKYTRIAKERRLEGYSEVKCARELAEKNVPEHIAEGLIFYLQAISWVKSFPFKSSDKFHSDLTGITRADAKLCIGALCRKLYLVLPKQLPHINSVEDAAVLLATLPTEIHVYLLNEGTDTWRPVPAIRIDDSTYELKGSDIYDPEDEEWQFLPGSRVKAVEKELFVGKRLVAIASI